MHRRFEQGSDNSGWDHDTRQRFVKIFSEGGTSIDEQVNNFKTFVRALVDDGIDLIHRSAEMNDLRELYDKHLSLYNELQPESHLATEPQSFLQGLKSYINKHGSRG